MARKKNSKLGAVLVGPALVIGGVLALWQNEGRFDYHAAAEGATVIDSPVESPREAIAYTNALRTDLPIAGDYVTEFIGYHLVIRSAEIYSWERSEDSDGNVSWSKGWESSLESNSRNSGLTQRLSSSRLYPDRYELGGLEIDPGEIHFVDDQVAVPARELTLSARGRSLGLTAAGDHLYLDKGGADDLGDERVSYRAVPNAPTATYFGVISGGRGMPKQFEQNDGLIDQLIGNDGILHHLVNGEREPALEKLEAHLARVTWLVRFGGTVAIVIGFFTFFSVFASLLYRIPLLGNVIEYGVWLVSLVLGLALALSVILAGVVFHNPLTVALPLVLILGGLVWFLRRSRATGRSARAALEQRVATQRAAPPPPPPAGAGVGAAPPPAPGARSEQEVVEATFVNLAALALAEGELDRREKRFLVRWGRENGVSADRMNALLAQARSDPPEAHRATRDDLELLALMALSDGVISKPEWDFLGRIAERLGLTRPQLRQLVSALAGGEPAPA